MGPTWGPSGVDRTQVGPMLTPWTLLSGTCSVHEQNPTRQTRQWFLLPFMYAILNSGWRIAKYLTILTIGIKLYHIQMRVSIAMGSLWKNEYLSHRRITRINNQRLACSFVFFPDASIPTFGNRCLSATGGGKQRSRLAGWVQLSAEAAPGPHGVPPWPPGQREYRWCGKFTWIAAL